MQAKPASEAVWGNNAVTMDAEASVALAAALESSVSEGSATPANASGTAPESNAETMDAADSVGSADLERTARPQESARAAVKAAVRENNVEMMDAGEHVGPVPPDSPAATRGSARVPHALHNALENNADPTDAGEHVVPAPRDSAATAPDNVWEAVLPIARASNVDRMDVGDSAGPVDPPSPV